MSPASKIELQKVRAAKPLAEEVFTGLLGNVAIGITRIGDSYCLKVNVTSKPDSTIALPEKVDGIPVVVEVTGPIKKR